MTAPAKQYEYILNPSLYVARYYPDFQRKLRVYVRQPFPPTELKKLFDLTGEVQDAEYILEERCKEFNSKYTDERRYIDGIAFQIRLQKKDVDSGEALLFIGVADATQKLTNDLANAAISAANYALDSLISLDALKMAADVTAQAYVSAISRCDACGSYCASCSRNFAAFIDQIKDEIHSKALQANMAKVRLAAERRMTERNPITEAEPGHLIPDAPIREGLDLLGELPKSVKDAFKAFNTPLPSAAVHPEYTS